MSLGRSLLQGAWVGGHSTSTSGPITNTITWGSACLNSQRGQSGGQVHRGVQCGQGPYAEAQEVEWALKGQLLDPHPHKQCGCPHSGLCACPSPLSYTWGGGLREGSTEGAATGARLEHEIPGRGQRGAGGAHSTHTAPGHMGRAAASTAPVHSGLLTAFARTHRPHELWALSLGWGTGPPGRVLGPTLGVGGFPWESELSVIPQPGIPGSIWGSGDPDPPARLAEVRTAAEGVWTDGRRAGQSHLCSAS